MAEQGNRYSMQKTMKKNKWSSTRSTSNGKRKPLISMILPFYAHFNGHPPLSNGSQIPRSRWMVILSIITLLLVPILWSQNNANCKQFVLPSPSKGKVRLLLFQMKPFYLIGPLKWKSLIECSLEVRLIDQGIARLIQHLLLLHLPMDKLFLHIKIK